MMRKYHKPRMVHKAAYVFNKTLGEYELTVCGKTAQSSSMIKTPDDEKVTCKECLERMKEKTL